MKFAPLAVILLAGCSLFKRDSESWTKYRKYTPEGRQVKIAITFGRGVTEEQVLRWIDQRCNQWIEANKASIRGVDWYRRITFMTIYEPVDHYRFEAGGPTGFAEGSHGPVGSIGPDVWHNITACVYTKRENQSKPESVPYPEFLEFRNDLWKWGVMPDDGIGFVVLFHELDHAAGVGH